MKVMCNQCGKVLDLMASRAFVVEEAGQLKTYYFWSDDHMAPACSKETRRVGQELTSNEAS